VRATKDIDLLVRPEDDEHVMQRVSKLDPETNDLLSLDLLVVGPFYESTWNSRISVPWKGAELSIVSRAGLATMKRQAGRLQDLADVAALEQTNDDDED
jgi:hypothetical protein